ncbi:MAG: PhoH family protein, partial [Pigmentiphaga sp.]
MSQGRQRQRRPQPATVLLDGDNTHLANLCGPIDENLRQVAAAYDVDLARRGNRITLTGERAEEAAVALNFLHVRARHTELSVDDVQLGLVELKAMQRHSPNAESDEVNDDSPAANVPPDPGDETIVLRTRRTDLRPRTPRQHGYLKHILSHDITFGTGPAGTGKTWLAVACAIDALERDAVQRLVLTRPAVEAGERLGFLPGDLTQKVDPYLRPLYDALYDLLGYERVQKLFEKQVIEIAPLAYMRGRTLNH